MKLFGLLIAVGVLILCSCGSSQHYSQANRADHIESFKNFDRKHQKAARVQRERVKAQSGNYRR